jgi:hypothetical protein
MLIVLIVRPSGLAGGREMTWPFSRAMRAVHLSDVARSLDRVAVPTSRGDQL